MRPRDETDPRRMMMAFGLIAGLWLTSQLLAAGQARAGTLDPATTATPPIHVANTQTMAGTAQVEIDNFDFSPMTMTVPAGTTVTWTNHDDVPHTVVSADDPHVFKSPPLDTDDAYSFTFAKPGTYKYFCSVHPKMVGMIVVKSN